MAKRNKKKKKDSFVIPAEVIWEARKPRYNGFATGHGPHGDIGYNRRKEKANFYREDWY